MLHVGAARHDGASGFFGLLDQRGGEAEQQFGDDAAVAAQPHANQRGDLVVAGTAGAQFAAEFVAGDVQQSTFEGGGLVLVILDRREGARIDAALQFVEGILHALQLVGGQQSGAAERTRMRTRARDVVVRQTPVELGGFAQSGEFRRRSGFEAAAPQGEVLTIGCALGHFPYLLANMTEGENTSQDSPNGVLSPISQNDSSAR